MSISFTAAKYIRRPVKVGCRIQTYHEKARVLKVHLLKKLRGGSPFEETSRLLPCESLVSDGPK
jgi:hypothetical protein